MLTFHDRVDAGRALASKLERYAAERPLILALPRGGVVVAAEIADALEAPLDVLVVRKLGHPGHPEYAVGAITATTEYLDAAALGDPEFPRDALNRVIAAERCELERRERLYRGGRPASDPSGRTVILVDDGLATGATAIAAIRALRGRGPARLVLAVPVGARESVDALRPLVDDLVCLLAPAEFRAVGQWYEDFGEVGDATVLQLLARNGARTPARHPASRSPAAARGA